MTYSTKLTRTLATCLCVLFFASCVAVHEGGGGVKRKIDKTKARDANIKLGMNYLQTGNRDSALRAFLKAQEMDKNSAEAYQGLALVHQLNGEFEIAEKNFKKALSQRGKKSTSPIHLNYGRFLLGQERFDDALAQFKKAAQDLTYLDREKAVYFSGLAHMRLGDTKRAKASFDHALNLSPRMAGPAIELAEIYFSERDYAKAKRYLDRYANSTRHSARSLWLGIRLERIFENKDREASYALALKNKHPYSKQYLDYKKFFGQ